MALWGYPFCWLSSTSSSVYSEVDTGRQLPQLIQRGTSTIHGRFSKAFGRFSLEDCAAIDKVLTRHSIKRRSTSLVFFPS